MIVNGPRFDPGCIHFCATQRGGLFAPDPCLFMLFSYLSPIEVTLPTYAELPLLVAVTYFV